MKYASLCLALVGVCSFSPLFAAGESDTSSALVSAVVQVKTFQYDAFDKTWTPYSLGSAVSLGGGKFITNAHVVSEENSGEILGAYMICKPKTWKDEPKCSWQARVIAADTKEDLAVLELVDSGASISFPAAAFSATEATLGQSIRAIGYPQNGGNTVTLTEGKVSGQDADSGWLKIDANIDAGNSGGGAFSASGELVGMPTAVVEGYSTLGYIIPAEKIKNYLRQARALAKNPSEILLTKRLNEERAFASGSDLLDAGFTLPNVSGFHFWIRSYNWTQDASASYYELISDTKDLSITLIRSVKAGPLSALVPQKTSEKLKTLYKTVIRKTGVRLGRIRLASFTLFTQPRTADADSDYGIVLDFGGGLSAQILGKNGSGTALRNAIALLSGLAQKDLAPWGEIRLSGMTIALPPGTYFEQSLTKDGELNRNFIVEKNGVLVASEITSLAADTQYADNAQELIAKIRTKTEENGGKIEWASVHENKNGVRYIRLGYWSNDKKINTQEMIFVWKESDEKNRYVFVRVLGENQSGTIATANDLAAGITTVSPFGLDLGNLSIVKN